MNTKPKIACLGWGSLIWDLGCPPIPTYGGWLDDGPTLKIEFSRISESRNKALTLVIDKENGSDCCVQYVMSSRLNPDDAICDLRSREGTSLKNIGYVFVDGSRKNNGNPEDIQIIRKWAIAKNFDVVIWTNLPSNFNTEKGKPFVKAAIEHIQCLTKEGKSKAAEYVWRAPDLVKTPLRDALQSEPWFRMEKSKQTD